MSDIRKKNGLLSVVSNHRLEYNHDMNWSEAAIFDIESSYVKRIVLKWSILGNNVRV